MTKYKAIFEKTGESWCEIYGTAEEALRRAQNYWSRLSDRDKRDYHIEVGTVDETCFQPKWMDNDYLGEDGQPDISNPETWKQSDGILESLWEVGE